MRRRDIDLIYTTLSRHTGETLRPDLPDGEQDRITSALANLRLELAMRLDFYPYNEPGENTCSVHRVV